jgi:hypothetical protein
MQLPARPVVLEVLAHIPTDFFHCAHCERLFDVADVAAPVHAEMQASYPLEMLEDARRLTQWLEDLSERYDDRLRIRIVDVSSPQGFLKALRYRVRRYPAFIINKRTTLVGWDAVRLSVMLDEEIAGGMEPGEE